MRRPIRAALLGALAGALLLSGAAQAQVLPDQSGNSSESPSAAAATALPSSIVALRAATRPFQDLQRAQDAGYHLFTDTQGIACIAMPGMGGMGVHFVNGSLVGNPAEHALQPEALVYRIDATGALRLAAVEYVVIASAWDATHADPPQLMGHQFMLTPAPNRYGLPAYYSLHAWAWYTNPAGTFAPYNPRVHC